MLLHNTEVLPCRFPTELNKQVRDMVRTRFIGANMQDNQLKALFPPNGPPKKKKGRAAKAAGTPRRFRPSHHEARRDLSTLSPRAA